MERPNPYITYDRFTRSYMARSHSILRTTYPCPDDFLPVSNMPQTQKSGSILRTVFEKSDIASAKDRYCPSVRLQNSDELRQHLREDTVQAERREVARDPNSELFNGTFTGSSSWCLYSDHDFSFGYDKNSQARRRSWPTYKTRVLSEGGTALGPGALW